MLQHLAKIIDTQKSDTRGLRESLRERGLSENGQGNKESSTSIYRRFSQGVSLLGSEVHCASSMCSILHGATCHALTGATLIGRWQKWLPPFPFGTLLGFLKSYLLHTSSIFDVLYIYTFVSISAKTFLQTSLDNSHSILYLQSMKITL